MVPDGSGFAKECMMAKQQRSNPLGYKSLPKSDATRVGCKVSWEYYRDEATAKEAAAVARHNAVIDASQGYDFGYMMPGTVTFMKDGEYAGMYEVCTS